MSSVAVGAVGVGVGPRAAATIIDIVILYVVGYIIAAATGDTNGAGFELAGISALLLFIVFFAYYAVMEVMWGGTVGKMALGLKVVTEDGSALAWGPAIIRTLLRIVDGFLIYLVGAIFVWTSPKKQRLGDRVAKTLVVKKGAVVAATPSGQF